MKVMNYDDWKKAVRDEYTQLVNVSFYLNEDGRRRLAVFDLLDTLATSFADTAAELVEVIDNDHEPEEIEMLNYDHAKLPIKALRRIAGK